jgi:uncharacterized protein YdeI (YjbR/CyaY-like superfamily)
MDVGETLYVYHREDWRAWLEKHFRNEPDIWLVYPKKSSGEPRIPYNDAVEEALCFGWIDSTVKTLDENRSAQRFSPRNPKSSYSQTNKERLRWLAGEGLLHPSVHEAAGRAMNERFTCPPDIMQEIEANEAAWKHWRGFSNAYKRIRLAYIDTARTRPEEFRKRLDNLIKKTEQNKQIGFGGMEKYF